MSELTAKDFVELYRSIYDVLPNPQRTPFPEKSSLINLYNGLGSVVGFRRFSKETFEELCGCALQECKYMPAPAWFNEKASELSAPGRQIMTALMLAPAVEPDNPEAQARIRLLIAEAEAKAVKTKKDKEARAKALIDSEFPSGCDPAFTEWIEANLPQLCSRFPVIAHRGGSNRPRLIYRFQREQWSRVAYIEYLDNGPTDMRSACPHVQPLEQPQRQLAAY